LKTAREKLNETNQKLKGENVSLKKRRNREMSEMDALQLAYR